MERRATLLKGCHGERAHTDTARRLADVYRLEALFVAGSVARGTADA